MFGRAPVWAQVLMTVLGGLLVVAIIVLGAGVFTSSDSSDDATSSTSVAETFPTVTSPPLTAPPPTAPTTIPPPHQVATLSGDADKQTALFTISPAARSWTIRWTLTGTGANSIQLKQPPDDYKALVVSKVGPTSDESVFYTTGSYFLTINTQARWNIVVTESFG